MHLGTVFFCLGKVWWYQRAN